MFPVMKTNLESQVASNVGTFDRQENIVRAVETIRDVLRSYTLPSFLVHAIPASCKLIIVETTLSSQPRAYSAQHGFTH